MVRIKRSLAIIIGINLYSHIPKLKSAVLDAQALADVLQEKYKYQVLTLFDEEATNEKFSQLIENLKNKKIELEGKLTQVEKSDRLLFYFAGHGFDREAEDSEEGKPAGYFMPQDADANDHKTWVSMQDVYETLTNLDCHHLLMILDCCFAGRISWVSKGRNVARPRKLYKQNYDRFMKHSTQQIITSAGYDEKALDSFRFGKRGEKNGHSPFAYFLLKILAGDSNTGKDKFIEAFIDDKVITAHELFTYLQNELQKVAKGQTPSLFQPQKYDEKTNQYVFLKGEYIFPLSGFKSENLEKFKLDESTNPYKGLASFEEEDSQFFLGRSRLIEEPKEGLLAKVKNNQLTVVLGLSGSGKSSLVKAGLIPALKREAETGASAVLGFPQVEHLACRQQWRILETMRPGELPFAALATAILPMTTGFNHDSLTHKLQQNFQFFTETVNQWSQKNPNVKLLLTIDQSEELITLSKNEEDGETFLQLLAEALAAPEIADTLRIVMTLRSDFEPQLRELNEQKYKDTDLEQVWQTVWQNGRFIVTPMNREELQKVIEEPAARRTLFFESSKLVNQLIDEVIQMPGALPLLSFTLSELYLRYLKAEENKERSDRTITEADYQKIGGVTRSLTNRADRTNNTLKTDEEVEESTIRDVMLRMVAIRSGELARRRVPTSELLYPEPKNQQAKQVIARFVEARLLVKGRDTEGQEYVEPVHDALVRGWKQIKDWLDEKQEAVETVSWWNPIKKLFNGNGRTEHPEAEKILKVNLPLQREVNTSANNWSQHANGVGFLWNTDPRLDLLKQVLNSQDNWFNQVETEFVERSIWQKSFHAWRNWSIAIAVMLGLSSLTIWSLISLRSTKVEQVRNLSRSAELKWESHQELEALLDLLRVVKLVDHWLLQLFKPDEDFKANIKDKLLKGVYGVKEFNQLQHEGEAIDVDFQNTPNGPMIVTNFVTNFVTNDEESETIAVWHLDGRLEKKYTYDEVKKILELSERDRYQTLKEKYLLPVLTFKLEEKMRGKPSEETIQAFSLDGKMRATADDEGKVSIYNVDGSLYKTFPAHLSEINTIRFSPDRQMIATGSEDSNVKLWNLDGTLYKTLPKHSASVNALDFSSDGSIIASASNDKTVKLWTRDGTLLKTLRGHQSAVWDVTIAPDNQTIASASNDETVKLWNREGKLLRTFEGHNNVVRAVAFSPDGKILASASDDRTVKLWRLTDKESLTILKHSFDELHRVSFHPNDQKIITARGYGDLTFWSQDGKYLETKKWHSGQITTFKFSPDGELIVSAAGDRGVKLFTADGSNEKFLEGHTAELKQNAVVAIAFSPDSEIFALGDTAGHIEIWNRDGSLLKTMEGHQDFVTGLSFSPKGDIFASGSFDGTVKLWNLDGSLKQTLVDNNNDDTMLWFNGVAFSPDTDQEIIVAAINQYIDPETDQGIEELCSKNTAAPETYYGTLKIWNRDGKLLRTCIAHGDWINAIAFSPDGQRIATASDDETVKIWKTDGTLEKTFYGHNDIVIGLAFSKDGKKIASASQDKTVLLWDLDIEQDLAELRKETCDWMEDYLKNNIKLQESESDRTLCDDL